MSSAPGTPEERLDHRIGWALFAAAFLALLFTQASVGFPRDESIYFAAAEQYGAWYQGLLQDPVAAVSDQRIVDRWRINSEHPPLVKTLAGWSELLFHKRLGLATPALGFRLPAMAIAALIPLLVFRLGRRLYGRWAGLFAAASFFCIPRQFFHGHLTCFDLPVAAMWLWVITAYVSAQETRRGWIWAGVAWGLALATKHNALFLPFVLAPFALVRAYRLTRGSPEADRLFQVYVSVHAAAVGLYAMLHALLGPDRFLERFEVLSPHLAIYAAAIAAGGWCLRELRRHSEDAFRALAPLSAMALLGPLLLLATWPYLWHHPVTRAAAYYGYHLRHEHYAWFYLGEMLRGPPFPLAYVVVVTALTVPITLFLPMVAGFASACARTLAAAWARLRTWAPPASWVEVLVLVNAVASIAIISHPQVPHFGGVKHWFPSMPFLAILGGLSAERAARELHGWLSRRWPKLRPGAVAGGLFALLLLPGAWGTARVHPYGTASYSEPAGGVPGAASLGMQRQFWSSHVTGVLPWINQHARPGERLWLHEVRYESFRDYQRNGLLRTDVVPAGGPGDATMAAYQYHQEFRDQEFQIWDAFGTTHPAYGLYVDETPQIVVYRRR